MRPGARFARERSTSAIVLKKSNPFRLASVTRVSGGIVPSMCRCNSAL